MMLAAILTALFAITAVATGLSLIDSWIRGRSAYGVLRREQALLDAGFVPQVEASEVRLRAQTSQTRNASRRTLASVSRTRTRRLPLPACA